MLMQIILGVCFLPVAVIIVLVMRNEAKPKKNIILGVTLPLDARESAAVQALVRRFYAQMNVTGAVLLALIAPVFFIQYDSIVMTYYLFWLIGALVLPMLPYVRAHRALKTLKRDNEWFGESTGVTLVDMTHAAAPKRLLSVWLFIPTVIISSIPLVYTLIVPPGRGEFAAMTILYGTLAIMSVAYMLFYRLLFRQRAEMVDENIALSAALTRVRRYNWGKVWIALSWLTCLFALFIWLFADHATVILYVGLVYTVALLAFVLSAEFKTRKVQQKLTADSGRRVYIDDDEHWLFGMLYNNPDDEHLIVNRRVGVGTTINLARQGARAFVAVTLLIVLGMPFIGFFMIRSEFTPVGIRIDVASVVAEHTSDVYAIPIAYIDGLQLVDTLPSNLRRTNGTGMKTVLKGNFSSDELGSLRVCLDPRSPPFILIETPDWTYLLGSSDEEQTMNVYQMLLETDNGQTLHINQELSAQSG